MTGVEADPQPVRVLSLAQNLGQVFEAISQVAALTCGVFEQDLSLVLGLLTEHRIQTVDNALQSRSFARPDVRSRMKHKEGNPELLAALDLIGKCF